MNKNKVFIVSIMVIIFGCSTNANKLISVDVQSKSICNSKLDKPMTLKFNDPAILGTYVGSYKCKYHANGGRHLDINEVSTQSWKPKNAQVVGYLIAKNKSNGYLKSIHIKAKEMGANILVPLAEHPLSNQFEMIYEASYHEK